MVCNINLICTEKWGKKYTGYNGAGTVTIFGLKTMVKSGVEKNCFEIL